MSDSMMRRTASWIGALLWTAFAGYHVLLAIGSSLPLPPSVAGGVFYILTVCAMVAWPKTPVSRVVGYVLLAASLPELVSVAAVHVPQVSRWVVELAGVVGAVLPVLLERIRVRPAVTLGRAQPVDAAHARQSPRRPVVVRDLKPARPAPDAADMSPRMPVLAADMGRP